MANTTKRRYRASDLIRGAAARDGLSQADLAAALGISRQSVQARYAGRTPWTLSELHDAAQVLGLDFYELVDASLHTSSDGDEVLA